MEKSHKWYLDNRFLVEVFALVNLASLAGDIYLAHSTNSFRHVAEYIPLVLSLGTPLLLLPAILSLEIWLAPRPWLVLGHLVGWTAVAIGVAGVVLHLESRFFQERTLASLVYAAPFAAPLSYAGLGLLLIMNRMVDAESVEWPYWVLLLTLGGFVGNFIFSLTDHAQNGFFHWTEWIPVVSSALAVGFLAVPFVMQVERSFLVVCTAAMLIQAFVGLLGFYFHLAADLRGSAPSLFENVVYGAPVFVPLLFPDLVLLSFIGIRGLSRHLSIAEQHAVAVENTSVATQPI
jgi:hypothetical protein